MPTDLQAHIKQEEIAGRLDTVWVSCAGENPADVENMGAIQYIPRRGFPGYYFPFTNTPGYLSPLVAVFFEKPKCTYCHRPIPREKTPNVNLMRSNQSILVKYRFVSELC